MRGLLTILASMALLLGTSSFALAQQTSNPIASLVGNWDLPGTLVRLKIHADGTVDHSALGEGTIRFDETTYYRLVYRQRHLTCQYDVRKYSDNEVTFTISVQPSEPDCELGALRRSPGSEPPEPLKNKSSDALPLKQTGDSVSPPPVGATFKDCDDCPELVVVPAGRFTMGSPDSEPERLRREGPQHAVDVSSFAVGRYAITRDQFDEFVKATGVLYANGCYAESESGHYWKLQPELTFRSPGFPQDGRHPVVCVNWEDAHAYVKWLSAKTGKPYRLLTEAEREYVARGGTSFPYWWGVTARPDQANYDPSQPPAGSQGSGKERVASAAVSKAYQPQISPASVVKGTVPVNLYQPNPWGLFQVHGNVAEWVEDCWNESYEGAPGNASAVNKGDCSRRVVRGGGWSYFAPAIRSAFRESAPKEDRYVHVGFRVARDLF
jgi:formylglycine-generating enzyme required for sulfatase activity